MGNCHSDRATVPSPPPQPTPAPTQTASSTHATSIPSSYETSSSRANNRRPSHDVARHDHEMTPMLSGAVTPERTSSHDRGYPPPVQNVSHRFRPRGPGRGSPHMGTTSPEGPHSHSSRITRTSSTPLLNGHQPTGTQVAPGLASGMSHMSAERQERRRPPSSLQSLLSFRILVVGKRGSGKSSLLNTVFNVDMSRAPTNVSGISGEFRPRDNRHLVVHECSAFGPGELQPIQEFITARNKSHLASERLHAIWICVPIPDAINGQFDEGLKVLLGTGVPLVIVFTMFDLIVPNVPSRGNEYEEAKATCRALFKNARAEIVSTQPRFRDLVDKLLETTDEVIIAHSRHISASSEAQRTQLRISPVTLAWSVSQRASRGINIEAVIAVGKSRYWRRLGSSEDFAGQTLANCVEVIHSDIVGVWNFPDKDKYLSSPAFKDGISHLIQDLSRQPMGSSSRNRSNGTPGRGAAWLNSRYDNSNENIRLVVGYIVDLTLILCGVFESPGNVSPGDVQSAMNNFACSSPKTSIHAEICSFIGTLNRFEFQDKDVVMTKIIDLIKGNCDPPSPQLNDPPRRR